MQIEFRKIAIKFEKLQLIFGKSEKKCLISKLNAAEYPDDCI